MLKFLLQNLYNSKWPKDFNTMAFVNANEGADSILSSKDIGELSPNEQMDMAIALLEENNHLIRNGFYGAWLMPLRIVYWKSQGADLDFENDAEKRFFKSHPELNP